MQNNRNMPLRSGSNEEKLPEEGMAELRPATSSPVCSISPMPYLSDWAFKKF